MDATDLRHTFLSSAQQLVDENTKLCQRVEELNIEADAWRAGNRDLSARNRLLTAENERFSHSGLILVLIDGDGALFTDELLSKGREGGKTAASRVRQMALEQAALRTGKSADTSVSVLCHIFTNKSGLANTFADHGIVEPSIFDEFCHGFNQASPLFTLTDVGSGKEAADSKIKDTLRLFATFPQTSLIIFGGAAHDAGYTPMLSALKTDGLIHKVLLLKTYSDMAFEIYQLDLPAIDVEGLFRKKKLANIPWKTVGGGSPKKSQAAQLPKNLQSPAPNAFPTPSNASSKPFAQPSSAPASTPMQQALSNGKDAAAHLKDAKEHPKNYRTKPCYRHHLLNRCEFGDKCTFNHEAITPAQREELSRQYPSITTVPLETSGKHERGSNTQSAGHPRIAPCFRFHLINDCMYGDKCTFSHEALSTEQKEDLRRKYTQQVNSGNSSALPLLNQDATPSSAGLSHPVLTEEEEAKRKKKEQQVQALLDRLPGQSDATAAAPSISTPMQQSKSNTSSSGGDSLQGTNKAQNVCYHYHILKNCAYGKKCNLSHEPISKVQRDELKQTKGKITKTSKVSSDTEGYGTPAAKAEGSAIRASANFEPLLQVIRTYSALNGLNYDPPAALKSKVGANVSVKQSYQSQGFESFKEFVATAENVGLVRSWAPSGPGSDLLGVVGANGRAADANGASADDGDDRLVLDFNDF